MPDFEVKTIEPPVKKVKLYKVEPGFLYREKTVAHSSTVNHNWVRDMAEGWMCESAFHVVCSLAAQPLMRAGETPVDEGWMQERRAQHEVPSEPAKNDVSAIVQEAVQAALKAVGAAIPSAPDVVVQPKRRGRPAKSKQKGGEI